MIQDIFLIGIIVVNIIDISGIVQVFKRKLWKWLKKEKPYKDYSLKPIDCSYCMTFWVSLLYVLIYSTLSLEILVYILFICFITPQIGTLQRMIGDMITKLLEKVWSLFD